MTVTTKLEQTVISPLSFTVSVIVAVPVCPFPGITMTVRAAPLPPNTILIVGNNVLLLETPVTESEFTGVKSSPIEKASAAEAVFKFTVCLAMVVIVGG